MKAALTSAACGLVAVAALATPSDASGEAVRVANPTAASGFLSGISAGGSFFPMQGLELARNLTPRVALTATYEGIGLAGLLQAGLRVYLTTGAVAPFVAGRAGACFELVVVPDGRELRTNRCFSMGLGLEVTFSRLQLTAQALRHGPDLWGNGPGYGVLVSAGLRF